MFLFPIRRILAIVLALSAALASESAVAQTDPPPPNLVFILTDDMGTEAIDGPYWDGEIFDAAYAPNSRPTVTRNLNRWAAQGISFLNTRHTPNCSPTRGGLFTGRSALRTGLYGVITRPGAEDCSGGMYDYEYPAIFPDEIYQLSLQTQERTIAEVLQEAGYYTILVDKWHCGYDENRGQLPTQQGFDEFDDWLPYITDDTNANYDNPDVYGDERISSAVDFAVAAVGRRGAKPYALFFHTISPHRRCGDADDLRWWLVDPELTELTGSLETQIADPQSAPPTERQRYTMNLEALDKELGRMLFAIGVVDDFDQGDSDYAEPGPGDPGTVVFFTADNGTDKVISVHGESGGKNSPYEGGILVPMFVFGQGIVPGPPSAPRYDTRLVSNLDYFETLCDVARIPLEDRTDPEFPIESRSFADSLGWSFTGTDYTPRTFTMSSFGNVESEDDSCTMTAYAHQIWKVSYVYHDLGSGDLYKLICRSGGPGLAPIEADCSTQADCDATFTCIDDELYNLTTDSSESYNLLDASPMNIWGTEVYIAMRDRVTDSWPSAVSIPHTVADLPEYTVTHQMDSGGTLYFLDTLYVDGVQQDECDDQFRSETRRFLRPAGP